jgi:hypothetical protein
MVKPGQHSIGYALLALTTSCAKLLGIEPAVCDPDFDPRSCPGARLDSGADAAPSSNAAQESGAQTLPDAQASTATTSADAASPEQFAHSAACKLYCATVQEACVEGNKQYATESSCLDICNELMRTEDEIETAGDVTNDTVECRQKAARAVLDVGSEIENLCQSAGMWGNTECGVPCEVYCGMMSRGCSTEFAAFDDCPDQCKDVPQPPTLLFGADSPPGNTLQCRVNHIRLATTTQNPGTHCPHAAGAAGPCETP